MRGGQWFTRRNTTGRSDRDISTLNMAARLIANEGWGMDNRTLEVIRKLYRPGMSPNHLADEAIVQRTMKQK